MTFEALSGINHRKTANAFKPNTMIDNLFDYPAFYGPEDFQICKSPNALRDRRVAVIGAGASGLMAAYLLSNAGAHVDIFEGSDRIGGRMCSVQFNPKSTKDHAVFELGCMRFPPTSKTLWSLFDKFNIKHQPDFPDPGVKGVFAQLFYKQELIDWPPPSGSGRSQPNSKLFQRIGMSFGNMLEYLVGDPDNPAAHPDRLYYFWDRYQNGSGPKSDVVAAWQKLIDAYKSLIQNYLV